MPGAASIEVTAVQAVRLLTRHRQTVAVAESLTGGLLIAALVGVPGASAVVRGGVVAYATDLKASVLGVDADLLALEGAVHPDVAVAMAHGVRTLLRADWGVATTGVAGPDQQDGRPVGEVHLAVVGPRVLSDQIVLTREFDPTLGREGIRLAAVAEALDQLVDLVGC